MIRLCVLACLAITTYAVHAQLGTVLRTGSLIDTWENRDLERVVKLQLRADGTYVLNEITQPFMYSDSTLTLYLESATNTYQYQVTGKKLTLTGGDLNAPVIFTRAGTMAEEKPKSRGSLYGKWEGNGEFFEFHTNGRCFYLGESYPYRLTQEEITLITPQKEIVIGYRVEDDFLFLTSFGQTSEFKRVK